MARYFTIPLIALLLVASGGAFAQTARADCQVGTPNCDPCPAGDTACMQAATDFTAQYGIYSATNDTAAGNTAIDPAAANTVIKPPPNPPGGEAYSSVMQWIMKLFAWLVGIAALALQNAVYFTVVKMGAFVKGLTAIGTTWRILRDIGNIALIFGFLAIGINIILGTDIYGWGQKTLWKLLLAAVFLNFSMLATEAVIDVGNLFATQFYTQINGGTLPVATTGNFGTAITNEGITNKIMSKVGLPTIYNINNNDQALKPFNSWTTGFMGIILFIVTAFVMFSLAFILIARFVVLLFLIITSPIGFAGLAIPKLDSLAKGWWHELFEQTITAPVLLLLLYIALAIITDASFLTGLGNGPDGPQWLKYIGTNGDLSGFAAMILSFLIAMGLLLAVTIAAKKLGAAGAGGAMKLAGAASFGAVAWGARSSGGWAAQRLSEKWRNSRYTARLSRAPIIGRAVSGVLDRGAKASFDIRGTGILGKIPGGGVNAGDATKGGYREWEKGKIKERTDYAKTLEKSSDEKAKIKAWELRENQQKVVHEEEIERMDKEHTEELKPLQEERKKQLAKVAGLRRKADATKSKADKDELAAAELTLTNQNSEIKELSEKQQKVRKELTDAQAKTLSNIKTEIGVIDQTPQAQYAKGIVWGPGQFFSRNKKASESILKEAKKSKSDRDLDVIKKILEEEEKKSGGGEKKEEKKEEKPAAGAAPAP